MSSQVQELKVIPLAVVVSEGPYARFYLTALRRAGFIPERIIYLVSDKEAPWLRLFPKLRSRVLKRYQTSRQWHWPRHIMRNERQLYESILDCVIGWGDEAAAILEQSLDPRFSYDDHARLYFETLCSGYSDSRFKKVIEREADLPILFTGGGILPKVLFENDKLSFLHLHPGNLPFVRGADGYLWSVLLRGRPSVSCFFMTPGIDMGPVLYKKNFECLRFDLPKSADAFAEETEKLLYRSLFSFIDPLIRALTLPELIRSSADFEYDVRRLPTAKQSPDIGLTFNFMHTKIRRRVLAKIFRESPEV